MTWKQKAEIAYSKDKPEKLRRAISAGEAMDNSIELDYDHGAAIMETGGTKSTFRTDQWLAYFSYEALGPERIKLLYLTQPLNTPH